MLQTSGKYSVAVGLLLVLLTLAVYAPALRHGFINYDDDRYVTGNPQVQAGLRWGTVIWAFTTFEQANWHPLTWISHAFDCQFFHLNPVGHHLSNLLLHSLNVLLLFLILRWFTGLAGRSFLVAALFAVHPLNVESVAWVAERKSVLSMLFFLLALAAYGWYVRKPGIARYVVVGCLFVAGLMSKPMVITLPFVLLLFDYWPLGRMRLGADDESQSHLLDREVPLITNTESLGKLCIEKIPILLLSVASAIITMIVQRAGGAVVSMSRTSLLLRIENAIVSYGMYLTKMVWPSRLAVLYPYPHAVPAWKVGVAAVLLLGISWAVLWYRASRYLLVGWFWYLGTMVPMIGLVQVGNQARADRYTYLPLIGLFILLVWGVADWAKSRHIESNYLAAAGFGVLAALCWATRIQLSYWQDDFTLWTHTLTVAPGNFVAENNLGLTLMREGKRDEAITHFRAASILAPGDATSQLNLGIYAQEQGDVKQAIARYETVLQLTNDPQLRASAYANLGTIYFALRDYTEAKQNFDYVIHLQRAFPIVIRDMGLIAMKNGDSTEAIRDFARLVGIEPTDVNYFLLAQAFHQGKRDDDSEWAYQQALRVSKDIDRARQTAIQLLVQ